MASSFYMKQGWNVYVQRQVSIFGKSSIENFVCRTPGITGAHTTTEPHKFSTTVPLTRVRFIPLLVRFDVERSVIPDTKQAKLLCRSHLVRLGPCCGDAYFAGVNFRSTVTPHSPLAFCTPLT